MRRVTSTLFTVLLIASSCGGGDAGSQSAGSDGTSPLSESSSETGASNSPTTVQQTTTTIDPGLQGDLNVMITLSGIDSVRNDFIAALEDDRVLERVDVFEVRVENGPPGSAVLSIAGSSGYLSDENQIAQAWEVATTVASFWEPGEASLRNDDGKLKPALELLIDGRKFFADHDLMARVADRTVTQQEWLLQASK